MTDTADSDLLAPDLIVLFGNENDGNGLKPIARERCERAAALAKLFPASLVLPTGGFGAHFNTTNRPHGELLREELERLGVPAKQILSYTNSCGTLEDVLFARKVAVDHGARRVTFVTSSFHMPRVKYLCERLFPDFIRDFAACDDDAAHPEKRASEKRKLRQLKKGWVELPLYGTLPKGSRFPTALYQNASREHKHYDFLSYLFVSGMLLSFAFPYTIDPGKVGLGDINGAAFLLSLVFIAFFYLMYYRAAKYAEQARTLLIRIEDYFQQPGFSLNCERHPPHWFWLRKLLRDRPRWFWRVWDNRWDCLRGFRLMLIVLALLMLAFQTFMAWWFFAHPPSNTGPDADFARVISLTLGRTSAA